MRLVLTLVAYQSTQAKVLLQYRTLYFSPPTPHADCLKGTARNLRSTHTESRVQA